MTLLPDRFVLFYPMRVVAACFLALIVALHGWQLDQLGAYHRLLIGVFLVYPHVVFLIVRRLAHQRAKIEHRAFHLDAFFLGLVVHLISFSLLPSAILVTVALANGLSLGGPKQMAQSAAAMLAGIGLSLAFAGFEVHLHDALAVDVVCAIFLFVYFTSFAYSNHIRSTLLQQSQEELEERRVTLEIEKARSDRLLLNLVPATLAPQLEREGSLAPAELGPTTLVAVGFGNLSRLLEDHGTQVLDLLGSYLQALDEIAARHGLEGLHTSGDLYLAAAGLPLSAPDHASRGLGAALEIRDYLADRTVARRASESFVLESGIGVHSGPVIGALLPTSKLRFEVWGPAVQIVRDSCARATEGAVLISDSTRSLLGDEELYRCDPVCHLEIAGRPGVELFTIDRRAA